MVLAGCDAATTDGFSATAPRGWADRTEAAETKSGIDYQAVYEGPTDDGVAASLAVDDVEPPETGGLTLARVVRDARAALRREGVRLAPSADARIDGEAAGRLDGTTRSGSRVRQVVTLHGGTVFTVTLVAAAPAFDARAAALDALLRSWRWD